jgi:DNA-binding YbaB/EbfC family protein
MFGKKGDMMGKLQEMKRQAEEIKGRLDNTILKIESPGGEVKIEITGSRTIRSLSIASALQHADPNELQQQLILAINNAIREADNLNETEMKKAASGMLPGL